MGTSHRYSSASDKSGIADASGSSPISASPSAELLLALARVEQSLKLVLSHIVTIQREMGIATQPTPDVPLKPDDTWNGSP